MFENRLYFSTMTVNERPCEINSNDRLALTSLPGHSSQTTSPAQESWGGEGARRRRNRNHGFPNPEQIVKMFSPSAQTSSTAPSMHTNLHK